MPAEGTHVSDPNGDCGISRRDSGGYSTVSCAVKLQPKHRADDAGLRMAAIGTKRQFARCKDMSGVGGKADLPVERPDFSV